MLAVLLAIGAAVTGFYYGRTIGYMDGVEDTIKSKRGRG